MLRFQHDEEQTKQTMPLPPTEEETARALSTLEQQQEFEHARGTVLKATLEEIGSTITEKDILAEVARQREEARIKQEAETHLQRQRQQKRKRFAIIAAVTFLPLLYLMLLIGGTISGNRERAAVEQAALDATMRQQLPTKWSLAPNTLALTRTATGSQIRTLAEIPDGEMVEVSYLDFTPQGDRESATKLKFRAQQGDTWQVIKYQGHPYIRGYLPTPMSAEAIRQGQVWLTSRAKKGEKFPYFVTEQPTAVTIPLEGLELLPNDYGGASEVNYGEFSGIQPDSHVFERWIDPIASKVYK